ncbi:UPF0489 protein C5orf22 homolog [Chironomus tepperi]|uniref:UPF0489 protein C5orf22 homolog n=1 Tax=Chironomus tepperi TaxID=113505 RepID=UPI00391FA322
MASSSAGPSTSKPIHRPKTKKFTKIPIFVVENHNEILELILPALANLYLPFQNNMMIHFDSHPDCCINRQMPAATVYNRSLLLESLSIENWLVPLTYAGHINELVWIRPQFANQISDGNYQFSVGDFDGKICVSSNLDYFLTDGSYKEDELLQNKKDVKLTVTQVNESLGDLVEEDRTWILDIDLDYFSTLNPFLSIYPKANTYDRLKEIFKMDKNYDQNDPKSIAKFVSERNSQLEFFDTIFQHMAQNGSLEKYKLKDESMKDKFELVKELIDSLCHNYSIYDIDWFIVNDAGCTIDDEEHQLPHHESSEEEIKGMIEKFERFLKSLKKLPVMVTISRSSSDGYTPNHQVELIQQMVLDVLQKVFGENIADQPTLWYKDSSIPALELVEPRKKKP